MKCPVCREADLVIAERQGIEIDYCRQCRGVWLDRGELDKIIERTAPVVGSTRAEAPVERLELLRESEPPAPYPHNEYPASRRSSRRDRDDDDDDDNYKRRHKRKIGGWLEELFDFD